jgi:hypothetical protein
MSLTAPRVINDRGLVQQWTIPVVIDDQPMIVSGSLYLRDPPGSCALFALGALAVPLVAGLAVGTGARALARLLGKADSVASK